MKYLFAAALAAAAPVAAQDPAPAVQPIVETPDVDPQRLAVATAIAAQFFADGTFKKVMETSMAGTSESLMDGLFDTQMGDLPGETATPEEQAQARRTMRELLLAGDPHFAERNRIMHRVMGEEMGELLTKHEPAMRKALAGAYARRFSVEQLTDIQRFLTTPTGRIFAAEFYVLAADPDLMKAMTAFGPELAARMPAIMEKLEAATAHLPQPPEPEKKSRRKGRR